jgi:GGDEF domain-containing protein
MPIAPNDPALRAVRATADTAVADLLPAREAVLARLEEQLLSTRATPAALVIIGLLPREDDGPTSRTVLAGVTTLLARSLRAEDWLGSSGPAEFVIVMAGSVTGAETAAARLVAAVEALGIPGLSAAAGLAPLTTGLSAEETLRRGTVSLTAARRVGPRTVVQHRLPY